LKREIDLTPYVQPIMDLAEKTNKRDYLMLTLAGPAAGFRRGEVVGNRDRRMIERTEVFLRPKKKAETAHRAEIVDRLKQGETVSDATGTYQLSIDGAFVQKMRLDDPLPGLQVEDFHDGGVWVKGKGNTQKFQPLPKKVYDMAKEYFGKRTKGPAFDFSADAFYKLVKKYCVAVGVPDADLAHPHRLRAAFAKLTYDKSGHDIALTQQLMRHATPGMTLHYVGERPMEEKRKVVEALFE